VKEKQAPDYGIFTTHPGGRTGWAKQLLASLRPGIPERFEDARNRRGVMYIAAHREMKRVSFRVVDDETWICLMLPEDENGSAS
jgi:hypothetical protein